jgi:hypothetical protein
MIEDGVAYLPERAAWWTPHVSARRNGSRRKYCAEMDSKIHYSFIDKPHNTDTFPYITTLII